MRKLTTFDGLDFYIFFTAQQKLLVNSSKNVHASDFEKKIKYGSELFDSNVLHMSKLTFEENDLQFLKLKRRKQH